METKDKVDGVRHEMSKVLGVDVGFSTCYRRDLDSLGVFLCLREYGMSDKFAFIGHMWIQHESSEKIFHSGPLAFHSSPFRFFEEIDDAQEVARAFLVPLRDELYRMEKSLMTEEQQQFVMKLMG